MDMSANLLTGFGGPKYSYYGNFWALADLGRANVISKLRVISRGCGLVMINTV